MIREEEENSDEDTDSDSSSPALEIDEGTDNSSPSAPSDANPNAKEDKANVEEKEKNDEPPRAVPMPAPAPLRPSVAVTSHTPIQRSDFYYQAPTNAHPSLVPGRDRWAVEYICGKCEHKVLVRQGEPIRCRECGGMFLWKTRTKTMMQFEAR